MDPFFIVIIVLVIVVVLLILYNLSIGRKIKTFNNINDRINNLNVLQEFLDTVGKDMSVDSKLETINKTIIEKFNIRYSSIIVFDGAEYVIKATNVDQRHWETMKNLHTDQMFKDSIETATPKYVTINSPEERLSYQRTDMARAKSALFFPLYIDNIYIGYWIIESSEPHAFDYIDTNVLTIVRDNIVAVLKTVSYQNTIENIYRVDKFTGLNSAEYLYGKGKRIIDKYDQSTVCMFKIMNIEAINEKLGRNIGTELIINVSNVVKRRIASDYIFVRYMGPKFAIVFSGVSLEEVEKIVSSMKTEIEKVIITNKGRKDVKNKNKKALAAHPRTNFVLATYYKGTGLEEVTKQLEEYLDSCDIRESNINCI